MRKGKEKMKHDRILALDGPLNFRDIGGYQNDKGQHVMTRVNM